MREIYGNLDGGIIQDLEPSNLPIGREKPFVWSSGLNVRFFDGAVEKSQGFSSTFGFLSAVVPYYVKHAKTSTSDLWLSFGDTHIWVTDGTNQADASRLGYYTSTSDHHWAGGFLKGVGLFTNGTDAPQSWVPSMTNAFDNLTWDGDAGTSWDSVGAKCNIIRPFGDYAVALDVSEASSGRRPRRVLWSHPADAGSEPYSWDYTNPARDAGYRDLDDTTASILDGVPLKDNFLIYKQDSVYRMYKIESIDIFGIERIYSTFGVAAPHCVKPFFGKHLVFTGDDLILHDGSNYDSVLDHRNARWLATVLNQDKITRSWMSVNQRKKEIWLGIPINGNDYANTALVWSWQNNSTTFKDIGQSTYMTSGTVSPTAVETFDTGSGTFDTDVGPFDSSTGRITLSRNVIAGTDKSLQTVDSSNVVEKTFIERAGLTLGDSSKTKYITAIYPKITGAAGTTVEILLGGQKTPGGSIQYKSYTHTIGKNKTCVRFFVNQYFSIRFQTTTTASPWRLFGFEVEFVYGGDR